MIKVYHYASLTDAEADRLNGSDGGWDSEPRFSRYADINSGNADVATYVKALIEGEYRAVAVVNGTKSDAFRLTNHIESDWRENDGVTFIPGNEPRSTSIGDLFEDTDTGAFYIVARVGFTKFGEVS